jgi:hypothetical protein
MQELPALRCAVATVFKQAIAEQRNFAHRFIFGSFGSLVWQGTDQEQPPDQVSHQIRPWRIALATLIARVRARPELLQSVVVTFLDDLMAFLKSYYGEVQASRSFAVRLRMDVIEVLSTFLVNTLGRYH